MNQRHVFLGLVLGVERSFPDLVVVAAVISAMVAVALLLICGQHLRRERAARRAAEDAAHRSDAWLLDSQKLLSLILDSSGVGISVTDAAGLFVYVNQTYCKITGRPAADLAGQHFKTVVAPHHHESIAQVHASLLNGQTSAPAAEWQLVRPDGSERTVSVSHRLLVRADGQRFRVATVLDLTDRKRAEKELRQRDLQLQRSMDVIPGVLYQFRSSPEGRRSFDFISEGARDLWGISPEQALANIEAAQALYVPEDMPLVRKTFAESARTLQPWVCQFRIQTPQGQRKWLRAHSKPIREADGTLVWHGVLVDVSAEMKAETELRQLQQAAEAASRAKSDFLAHMSHELRTPLNAILGFSRLLAQDPGLAKDQQDSLRAISRAGEHLLGLVNNTLELARLEAGGLAVHVDEVELPRLFLDVESMYLAPARAKGVRLLVEGLERLPRRARLDGGKLRQVLLNLVGNAVKFTNAGTIWLRARHEQGWLHVAIQDTGVGIHPDELAHLFVPFVQTTSGRSSGLGTGLGLAISRQILDLLGGRIEVESEPGQGTVFRFAIPMEIVQSDDQWPNDTARGQEEIKNKPGVYVTAQSLEGQAPPDSGLLQLESLSRELLQDLRQAALRCDPEQLSAVIERVRPVDAVLAKSLTRELDTFAFHRILSQINNFFPPHDRP